MEAKKSAFKRMSGILGFDVKFFSKNFSWLMASSVFQMLFGLAVSVVLARLASKQAFGEYNFLISVITILSIVSIPGLNTSVFKSASEGKDATFLKAFRLMLLWSLLGIPIIFGLGLYYSSIGSRLIAICLFSAALFFPLYYPTQLWVHFLQGKEKFSQFARYNIISNALRTAAILAAIFISRGSIVAAFLTFFFSNIIVSLYIHSKVAKLVSNDKLDKRWKERGYNLILPAPFQPVL